MRSSSRPTEFRERTEASEQIRSPRCRHPSLSYVSTNGSKLSMLRATGLILLAAVALICEPASVSAQETVSRWLLLGPVRAERPVLAPPGDSVLLDATEYRFGPRWPSAGRVTGWLGRDSLVWRDRSTSGGRLELAARGEEAQTAYAVAYVSADRWQEATVRSDLPEGARLTVDGEPASDGSSVQLRQGKHRLSVHTVRASEDTGSWSLRVSLEPKTDGATLSATVDPTRPPGWMDLRDRTQFSDIVLAPSGERFAVGIEVVDRANDEWSSRLQVRSLPDGEVTSEIPVATDISGAAWSRDGERLAFAAPTDQEDASGSDLWLWRPGGESRRLLRAQEGLSDITWGPDGETIYFTSTVGEAREPDDDGVTRITEVWQRPSFWGPHSHLYAVNVETGNRRKLVGDPDHSVNGPTLSPDGTRLVFTRDVRHNVRPHLESEIRILDLETGEARTLLTLDEVSFGGPTGFAWSPDGRGLAFCAPLPVALEGESPEGDVARAETGEGRRNRKASVYETELFAVPISDPEPRWLSRDFPPAMGGGLGCQEIEWSAENGRIYVGAEDGARTVLSRTTSSVEGSNPAGSMERVEATRHVLGSHDLSATRLVGTFESPTSPPALFALDLNSGEATKLSDPGLPAGDQLRMPGWEAWSYDDGDGHTIEAWYWTPPGFDPSGEYPLIVHYYGGTLAQKKGFDEQLLWYASRGYVVLMMNPGGAPGYGHEFSNEHIDDWGYPAGTDIIRGVRRFASEHEFIDDDRIGNFGGSYGGFMTMHVLARTDTLFRAAAERAGISGITGYWGTGWSGYSYTDGTCPGCYPWNRTDIYVERSPIYRADEITEPLLIMHGTNDHNVPQHQSEQIFTALRALDTPVEYLRFHGERHGIGSTPSVRKRFEASILEWFDRWLRDRPAAWNARWDAEGTSGR